MILLAFLGVFHHRRRAIIGRFVVVNLLERADQRHGSALEEDRISRTGGALCMRRKKLDTTTP